MRTLRFLPILAVLLAAAPASAQVSIWLQRGVSGFGVGTGVFRGNDATQFTLGGGYSYQGWIDFDLDFGYTVYDEDVTAPIELAELALAPTVQLHPIKQSKTVPISLSIGASATFSVLDSDDFIGDAGGGSYGAGAALRVYRFFRIGESTGIIPAAALSVNFNHAYLNDQFGDEIELDDPDRTGVSVAIGAYFAY